MEIKTTFRFYITMVTIADMKNKFCKVSSRIVPTQKNSASKQTKKKNPKFQKLQVTRDTGKNIWK